MHDGIVLTRLSDFSTVKPFQIKIGKLEEGQSCFAAAFPAVFVKSQSFNEFAWGAAQGSIQAVSAISVKLDKTEQLAALQYVLGVRRNKFNTDLLVKGPLAAKRQKNMVERLPLLKDYAEGRIDQWREILAKQPCFTEYASTTTR